MAAVVHVESGGNELALHVNGWRGMQPRPGSAPQAAATVRRFVAMGYTVDIGPAQVNSANLPGLGYTVEQVLEPCANLRAGATILAACYERATGSGIPAGDAAIAAALSCYNTNDLRRGILSGYVARYRAMPAVSAAALPAIAPPLRPQTRPAAANSLVATADAPPAWYGALATQGVTP
jgi:type IV secretion system protein VirB1